jgi:[acyl-carrier-protein] S-malonyltransferase
MSLAVLFPGQGAQYAGMGRELYESHPTVRDLFAQASKVLGYDLGEICFADSDLRLARTEYAQPAILTLGYAGYAVLAGATGIEPAFLAGHSLGEITALACAGAISFSDAVAIAARRGRLMQEVAEQQPGEMLAVIGIELDEVEATCRKCPEELAPVVVANCNSPVQNVISGRREGVEVTADRCRQAGARTVELNVGVAFHSPLMRPVARQLQQEIHRFVFAAMARPVIANVTAMPIIRPAEIPHLLVRQITAPVRWYESVELMRRVGVTRFIEMPPGKVLTRLLRGEGRGDSALDYDSPTARDHCSKALSTPQPDQILERCLLAAAAAPNYNQDSAAGERFADAYNQLQELLVRTEEQDRQPSGDEVRTAFDLLSVVLAAKQVPEDEQEWRRQEINKGG